MADFDTIAADTADKLSSFVDESANIQTLLEETESRFTGETTAIETLWSTTENSSQALLIRIDQLREEQTTAFDEAMQTLRHLAETVAALSMQVDEQVDLSQQEIANLQTALQTAAAEIQTAVAGVEERAEEVKTKASEAETELEALFTGLEQELEQSSQTLQNKTTELTQRVQQVEQLITSDCAEKLDSKMQEFGTRITEAVSELGQNLEQAAEEADTKTDEILAQAKEAHDTFISEMEVTTSGTQDGIKSTNDAVTKVTDTFGKAKEGLSEGVKLTNTGFDTAVGALKEIQKILERF